MLQVQEKEQGIWCRTEILYRPSQPAPAEVYSQLGLHRHPLLRRAAQLSARCRHLASQATTVLDRTNAMGTPDCLLVSFSCFVLHERWLLLMWGKGPCPGTCHL